MSEDGDWSAVADVVSERLDALGMSQKGLAKRAKLSPATIRAIQHNYGKHRPKLETLAQLSEALDFPPERLRDILQHRAKSEVGDPEPESPMEIIMRRLDKLDMMEVRLNKMADNIDTIDKKLDRIVVDIQYPDPSQ